MSLTLCQSLRTKNVLPLELLSYSFHTTCVPLAARGMQRDRGSSRTRLAKDLTPRSKEGLGKPKRLEVAPRAAYQRESVPHFGLKPREPRKHVRSSEDGSERRSFDSSRRPERRRSDSPVSRFGSNRRPERRSDGPASGFNGSRRPERKAESPTSGFSSSRRPERKTDGLGPGFSSNKSSTSAPRRQPNRQSTGSGRESAHTEDVIAEEFDLSTKTEPARGLPSEFTSPPLLDGLRTSIHDVLGEQAKPTPIQSLSLKHLFTPTPKSSWREYLLASETGSGKSFAYMLPMLQDLKTTELSEKSSQPSSTNSTRTINPRAIVLAPTHELSRQLSGMAKSLLHNIKLRVICASQANTSLRSSKPLSAAKLSAVDEYGLPIAQDSNTQRPVDVLVGTTSKVLEMVRGHGWNWSKVLESSSESNKKHGKFVIGEPEVGLERVEWVIVDEADVLFDPDFKDATRMLLADIAAARGHPVTGEEGPVNYPFNLLLTSATIPSSLATYLDTYHPNLKRLASPNLHKLPSTLKTEHAPWMSGNRAADIEARIRRIWYSDTAHGSGVRSKVLVFCNKSAKVAEFGKYLAEKGMPNVALTSTADARKRGNNHHIDSFLRTPLPRKSTEDSQKPAKTASTEEPHVLITTSLLSRGLDFSPDIKNVFIVDPPRNMIDFLHRAGRTGRAGARGTVVIFGKTKGRGVTKHKEVRKKVNALL